MNDNVYITLTLLYNTTQENENIQIHSLLEKIGITYNYYKEYYIEVRKLVHMWLIYLSVAKYLYYLPYLYDNIKELGVYMYHYVYIV